MRGSVYIRQSRSALIGPLLGSLRSYWPLVTLLYCSAGQLSVHLRVKILPLIAAEIGTLIGDDQNILSLVHCRPITCLFCYQVWDNLPQ